MRIAPSHILGLILMGLSLPGCGNFSVPRVAANGTTIMIAVPDGFKAGFGRVLNQNLQFTTIDPGAISIPIANPPSYLEDFQQGELLFALREGPDISSTFKAYLRVRYITRVHLDEASSAALPAEGEVYDYIGTPVEAGQVVAFVDIPYEVTPPGTYYIFMERWKRGTEGAANHFFKEDPTQVNSPPIDWRAWGGFAGLPQGPSPTVGMEITIVASSYSGSIFSDTSWGFDKWFGNYSWRNFTADLGHFSPRPKLRIWIQNFYTLENPAAWEWTIQYPAGKIEITGAELGSLHRSGGFAAVSPATSSPTDCTSLGTTRISVIDPDQTTPWVNVVYRLRDFPQCGRAVASDFTATQGPPKAYDVNGNAIAAWAYLDPDYSF